MRKIFIMVLFVLISVINAHAVIISVPDDQATIQDGIDVSSDGDTVLVSPGIYLENIRFNGKKIVLGSFFVISQNTDYISQTVIDGDQNSMPEGGAVVAFRDGEDSRTVLCGFTIRNGNGSLVNIYGDNNYYPIGGGIYCIWNSNPVLDHLIITDNSLPEFSGSGGGLFIHDANPVLKNLTICNNLSSSGGGVQLSESNSILENVTIVDNYARSGAGIFIYESNPVLKNVNIRSNSGIAAAGLYCGMYSQATLIDVTIAENTAEYTGGGIYNTGTSNITFDYESRCNIYLNNALHGHDIYTFTNLHVVADTFTVLSPTSYHTLPQSMYTFDILNGRLEQTNADLYVSPNGNDTNSGLSPQDPLKTIDCANSKILADPLNQNAIHLGPGIYSPDTNGEQIPVGCVSFTTLQGESAAETILDGQHQDHVVQPFEVEAGTIENMTIRNGFGTYGGGINIQDSDIWIKNVVISGNATNFPLGGGGGICCNDHSNAILENVLITNNSALGIEDNASAQGGGIRCQYYSNMILKNVTVTGNSAPYGGSGGIYTEFNANVILVNSIVWDNANYNIYIGPDPDYSNPSDLVVAYSDIKGGEEEIMLMDSNQLHWLAGNIDSDPIFIDSENFDYHLLPDSPCIDTGIAFFEYEGQIVIDLDPEAYNGIAPDMGAFEFDSVHIENENMSPLPTEFSLKQNYPNPFNPSTTINYDLPRMANISLAVYDVSGRLVKTLLDHEYQNAGRRSIIWDGTDENDNPVNSGVYLYKLQTTNIVKTKRMILIK